jgi:hypothetical protein
LIKWYEHVLFAVVTIVALSMTWYSMMDLATGQFNLPTILSMAVSLAFDGAAILSASLSIKYARTGDSGLLTELATFLFVAASVYLTVQHAVLENYGVVGMVMFGAAPIIVGIILKLYLNFLTRQARREAGRIVDRLPVAGALTWLRYPRQSFKLVSVAMQNRLIKAADRVDMPEDRYGIFSATVGQPQTAVETTEKVVLEVVPTQDKDAQQLSETSVTKQIDSPDTVSLPVWLPNEPTMTLGKLVRTCMDNGVLDLETIFRYAKDIKGQEINKMSLSRTLSREKQKTA